MFRRFQRNYNSCTPIFLPFPVPGGGGSLSKMDRLHLSIIAATTCAGFMYGNYCLYNLHKKKILRNSHEMLDNDHKNIQLEDVLVEVGKPTVIGAAIGIAYPFGIPLFCMYHYYRWQERKFNTSFGGHKN